MDLLIYIIRLPGNRMGFYFYHFHNEGSTYTGLLVLYAENEPP